MITRSMFTRLSASPSFLLHFSSIPQRDEIPDGLSNSTSNGRESIKRPLFEVQLSVKMNGIRDLPDISVTDAFLRG